MNKLVRSSLYTSILGLILISKTAVLSADFVKRSEYMNPSPKVLDEFGTSVGATNNIAVIGTPFDDTKTRGSGAVYIYNTRNDKLLKSIFNPSPEIGARFGTSVSVSGNRILIGAPYEDYKDKENSRIVRDAGKAYLFHRNGRLLKVFEDPNPQRQGRFGYDVDLDGNLALIGAPTGKGEGRQKSGVAYLFRTGTGRLENTFSPPEPQGFEQFGFSVSLDEERVLIGSPKKDVMDRQGSNLLNAGMSYLFISRKGEFRLLSSFVAPRPKEEAEFGSAVNLNEYLVLVGAPYHEVRGRNRSGTAYLFNTVGDLKRVIPNPLIQEDSRFGIDLDMGNRNLVIGASGDDRTEDRSGVTYVYRRFGGRPIQTLFNPVPQNGAQFGSALDLVEDDFLLIGSFGDNRPYNDSGVAFLYQNEHPNLRQFTTAGLGSDSLLLQDMSEVTQVPEPLTVLSSLILGGLGISIKYTSRNKKST